MQCVSFVSFHILLNGEPMDCFVPTRDLRQRDPLANSWRRMSET